MLCKNIILDELKAREPLFGRWVVGKFIGAGANGCVFTIEREDLGQKFVAAIKVIPLSAPRDENDPTGETLKQTIGKDAREILHMYNLAGHTNIVGWHNHDIITAEDEDSVHVHIMVMMDYLPNSLAKELKKGPLPWQNAVEILIGCLKGLEHIHAHNIVHRDIKPENIFIAADGTPKIGDFGISRQVSDATQAKTVAGTPLYMAPEVYSDPFGMGYGLKCDIYSLGLVAYEMIEGCLPFEEDSDTTQGMVKRRFSGEPIEFASVIPAALKKALLRALAYDPDRRFPSVQIFREALERVLQPQQIGSLMPGTKRFKAPPLAEVQDMRKDPKKRLVRSRTAPPTIQPGKAALDKTTQEPGRGFLSFGGKAGAPAADPDAGIEATQTMLRTMGAPLRQPPRSRPQVRRDTDTTQQTVTQVYKTPVSKADLDQTIVNEPDQTVDSGMRRRSLIGDTLERQEKTPAGPAPSQSASEAPKNNVQNGWEEKTSQPESAPSNRLSPPDRDDSPFAQTLADHPIGQRTMIRILEADTAVNFVYYSREICQKLVLLAKKQIKSQGHVPLEFKNRFSSRVNEEKICARIISIGLVDDLILAEIVPVQEFEHELAFLLEQEVYQVVPKYLGFTYNLGENTHIKPEHLQLLSFSIYDKTED